MGLRITIGIHMTELTLSDYRRFTATASQARVLELVNWLFKTTTLTRNGERWTAPKLDMIAEKLLLSKATVSRALNWLSEHGLIALKKMYWNHAPRLYIQTRELKIIETQCNEPDQHCATTSLHDATTIKNTLNKYPKQCSISAATLADEDDLVSLNSSEKEKKASPPPPSTRLRGGMDGAKARLAEKQHKSPPNEKLTAWQFARIWNKLLIQNGDKPFEVDPKTVRMIKLCAKRYDKLGRKLYDDLPAIIQNWINFAPKDAGPNPVPYSVRRAAPKWLERCDILDQPKNKVDKPVMQKPKTVVNKPYTHMSLSEKMKHDAKKTGQ